MPSYSIVARYYLLLNKLSQKNYPGISDILRELGISRETFFRDIKRLWNDFDIRIDYDHNNNGYYIDEKETIEIDEVLRYFELAAMSASFSEIMKDRKTAKKYIIFDKNYGLAGMKYFNEILFAIKSHKLISLSYKKFTTGETKESKVAPLFLKEYEKRWYVITRHIERNSIVTYALDRIQRISYTDEAYIEKDLENIKKRFDDIIGVSISDREPEVIELSFTPEQGKYVNSMPWHSSQTILEDSNAEFRIGLYVSRNIELEKKILREGDQVKVIKPEWLKNILLERARGFIESNT